MECELRTSKVGIPKYPIETKPTPGKVNLMNPTASIGPPSSILPIRGALSTRSPFSFPATLIESEAETSKQHTPGLLHHPLLFQHRCFVHTE
ncbi:MAG: hypothetical protein JJU34_16865 [Lunatimonas sp.]|uniref:hypothetical protein n=1 Tax=Lunatimonas sp. TaxID=2060141 RepID=UPI00263A93D1|nr:hypothetical protein [Lunatimonas sp.]MCC5938952.1 hypothetical protein [Lunatimonas sp.]